MLNQLVLVGRITEDVESDVITIAVQRYYKNEEGEYDIDFIPISLTEGIYKNVKEMCKKGDLVGVKGSLEVINKQLIVVASKLTFLSSNNKEEII